MQQIYICVGSSCHLKGSYQVIKTFQELIEKNHLEDKVELKASFCLGHCTRGVCAKAGDAFIDDLNISNAEEKFMSSIMNSLQQERQPE